MKRLLRRSLAIPAVAAALTLVPAASALTEQDKLLAPDGSASDQFGHSVAIDGDTAIVGAPYDDVGGREDQGSAHIFVRNATTGAWEWRQQLFGPAQTGAHFGHSVALSGGTAIVGAPYYDEPAGIFGPAPDAGWFSLFVHNTTSGSWEAAGTDVHVASGAQNGWSVALDGDTAVGGAPGFGGTRVWRRTSGGVWAYEETLFPNINSDRFGASVAVDDGTVVVGAPSADISGDANQGAAYVFVRSGSGWTQQQPTLVDDNGAPDDNFGYSVAVSGDTTFVGAWLDDIGINVDQGSAYIWTRTAGTWTQRKQLLGAAAGDAFFGLSVALSGNRAVVGAYADDVGTNRNQGAAYAFTGSGSNWTQQAQLTASDGRAFDHFGVSVGLSGDRAIVGAFWHDLSSADPTTNEGAAYIYSLAVPTAVTVSALSAERAGRVVTLRWRSGDPSVLGYRVSREYAGKRVLLTTRLVTAARSGTYRYLDRPAPRGPLRYHLQAVRSDGTTAWAGAVEAR